MHEELSATVVDIPSSKSSLRLRGPQHLFDGLFRGATLFFGLFILLILGGVAISLVVGSSDAYKTFGLKFLVIDTWNPATDKFGALVPIYGTLMTSLIAMVVGIPLSFGVAVFITELCPALLKRPLSIAIELLAGIPSIIYGIWGLFVFAPFLQEHVQPFLIQTIGRVPVIGALFAGPPFGIGILTAGLILAIMVLPFISSIMRDVFETVPPMLRESAYGLGCTTWEVVWRVVLPYTKVGVTGGIMLGLGRAMGETMAVTFIIGNSFRISSSIFAPGTTISAAIASEFAESDGLHQSSLILLGLLLFVLTFFVLAAARLMLLRLEQKAGN